MKDFQPVGKGILIKVIEEPEHGDKLSKGGIVIPDNRPVKMPPKTGVVVRTGDGCTLTLYKGDIVWFDCPVRYYDPNPIADHTYGLVDESNIIAVTGHDAN